MHSYPLTETIINKKEVLEYNLDTLLQHLAVIRCFN